MIECKFTAAIDSVKVKVKEQDEFVIRLVEMKFSTILDTAIAAALGDDAKTALAALENHGMEKVVLPLDALTVTGELRSGTGAVVDVPQLAGVNATCEAGKDEGPPTIAFLFRALWSEPVWIFLGKYTGAYVDLDLKPRQLSMELPVPAEAQSRLKTLD